MKTLPFFVAGFAVTATFSALGQPPEAESSSGFAAHEWGTFTSVQGADGVQLEWNPWVAPELPKFVYDVRNPLGRQQKLVLPYVRIAGKTGTISRLRMETPVIYFYSKERRTVDVDVNFPDGRVTEWYPQLSNPKDQGGPGRIRMLSELQSTMRWGGVEILPADDAAAAKFPKEAAGSHYYAARETDANPLHVKALDGSDQYEKFLFYRGVAQFQAPLEVSHWGEHAEQIRIQNHAKQPMGPYFIYSIRGNKAALVEEPVLDPGVMDDKNFKFDEIARPADEVRQELGAKLCAALTKAGLYDREAAAMVKTWDDSWLGEPGLRVLYVMPQQWANEVLPVKISPAPAEMKRVFVGRAEILTNAQEWSLLKETLHYAEGGTLEKKAAVAAVNDIGLGRFADPAFRHLAMKLPSTKEFSQASFALLEATKPANAKKQVDLADAP